MPSFTKQDKGRAQLIMDWFNAMATVEERLLLKPPRGGAQVPDEGDRRRTAGLLQALVIARLSEEFQNAEVDVPRELKKNQLSANALSNRVRALGELKPEESPQMPQGECTGILGVAPG